MMPESILEQPVVTTQSDECLRRGVPLNWVGGHGGTHAPPSTFTCALGRSDAPWLLVYPPGTRRVIRPPILLVNPAEMTEYDTRINQLSFEDRMGRSNPNILFIMTDQESTSLSGCYGNQTIKTPARDSIAENGIRFQNHYVASFPCSPSRATMVTGLLAHHHGVVTNGIVLDEQMETLGSQVKQAGYETFWIGKSHMGGWFEPHDEETCPYHELFLTDQGFQWKKHPGGAGGEDYALNGFDNWISGWSDYRAYLQGTDLPDEIKHDRWVGGHAVMESGLDSGHAYSRLTAEHHMAHWMSDRAVDALETHAESDRPFCMVLSYYAPHHPVAPPKPYDTMYRAADMVLPESYRHSTSSHNLPGVNPENQVDTYVAETWTEEQSKAYLARYHGYVTYLDDQMMRVLDALRATGQYENTIVVFSSDHGDMLCEQGMIYKHTFNGYDTLMKVPLMVQWPQGITGGQVCEALTSHVDLTPMLLTLAGVEPTVEMDGISTAGLLTGETTTAARDAVFIDVMNEGFVMRDVRWKFVLNAALSNGKTLRKMDELYDMEQDPLEMTNLARAPGQQERVEQMTLRIFAWLDATGHPYASHIRKIAE